ncbi:MAG TPA: ABC transporter permease subunit, partial [Pseudobdellovibrionaceae bacterium]|nr:ABC transporter permease subunit [Pseudobdellovibrionaceae bacterium]
GEVELFRLYRAGPLDVFLKLRLPRAYPSFYAGLKVSAGLAVIGTVTGEFVAGGGLGALIDSARTQQRIDLVFGALILLSLIGLFLIGFLRALNGLINMKRPYGLLLKD